MHSFLRTTNQSVLHAQEPRRGIRLGSSNPDDDDEDDSKHSTLSRKNLTDNYIHITSINLNDNSLLSHTKILLTLANNI